MRTTTREEPCRKVSCFFRSFAYCQPHQPTSAAATRVGFPQLLLAVRGRVARSRRRVWRAWCGVWAGAALLLPSPGQGFLGLHFPPRDGPPPSAPPPGTRRGKGHQRRHPVRAALGRSHRGAAPAPLPRGSRCTCARSSRFPRPACRRTRRNSPASRPRLPRGQEGPGLRRCRAVRTSSGGGTASRSSGGAHASRQPRQGTPRREGATCPPPGFSVGAEGRRTSSCRLRQVLAEGGCKG